MCSKKPSQREIDHYFNLLFVSKPQCRGDTGAVPASAAQMAAAGFDQNCPAHLIIMVGGPGSGKTAARLECITQLRKKEEDFVIISSDDIIASLFGGDNSCRGNVAPIIDDFADSARKGGYSVVYDTLGLDSKWILSLAKKFKEARYQVTFCIVDISKKLAIERMKARVEKTGQPMPPMDYIDEKYGQISASIRHYLAQDRRDSGLETPDIIDNLFMYDNRGSELSLLFARIGREYQCADIAKMKKLYPDVVCRVCKGAVAGAGTRGGQRRRRYHRTRGRKQRRMARHTRRKYRR